MANANEIKKAVVEVLAEVLSEDGKERIDVFYGEAGFMTKNRAVVLGEAESVYTPAYLSQRRRYESDVSLTIGIYSGAHIRDEMTADDLCYGILDRVNDALLYPGNDGVNLVQRLIPEIWDIKLISDQITTAMEDDRRYTVLSVIYEFNQVRR